MKTRPYRFGRSILAILALFFGPLGVSAAVTERSTGGWSTVRRDATGLAPDPASTPEAVVQVYAARTYGWRGAFAVHTWLVVKPTNATSYRRYEVIGWGVDHGVPAVRINSTGPDNYWFGSKPDLLLDKRGEGVDALIEKIEAAIQRYPYPQAYTTWPGPNSNTFVAFVAREVSELRLELPSHAIGKDYLPDGQIFARSPSGTGVQISLFGLTGLMVGTQEGLEVNLLGLTVGIGLRPLALKLPGLGRVGGG